MKDKYFLDTNIFAYTFDPSHPAKQKIAHELINYAITDTAGIISYQVIQEFINVATRKFATPLTTSDLKIYVDQILVPLCELYPSTEFYHFALEIKDKTHFAFYDSLIVAAAIKTGCKILYSEDLHHKQKIGGLIIKNPFLN